jgi:RHS repeat-associated protein
MNRWLIQAVAFAVAVVPQVFGQEPNLEMGYKPYNTFHAGDIDSINMTNGNPTVRIPLVSYPQRGDLRLNLAIAYDHTGFAAEYVCYINSCNYIWYQEPNGPFLYDDQTFQLLKNGLLCPIPGSCSRGDNVTVYVGQRGDESQQEMVDLGNGISRSTNAAGLWGSDNTNPTVIDRDGIRYQQVGSSPVREDRNGNQISGIVSSFPGVGSGLTDTVGRQIPSAVATSDFTGCTGSLSIVSASVINFPAPNGGADPIKFCYVNVAVFTNFQPSNDNVQLNKTVLMLQSVVLANGTAWTFEYSDRDPGDSQGVNYGDLTKITFPTDGTISYTWGFKNCAGSQTQQRRGVLSRTVNANDGTSSHTWTYNYGYVPNQYNYTVRTDPLLNDTFFSMFGSSCSQYVATTQHYQGSRTQGTLKKTVSTTYNSTPDPLAEYKSMSSLVNVVPVTVTTTWPGGKVSQVQTDYNDPGFNDPYGAHYIYGSVAAEREYDFGNGTPGPLLRQTIPTYLAFSNSNYLNNNLLNLVSSNIVKDGGGTPQAKTTYVYDGAGLVSSGISTQHDSNPPSGTYRGNQTSVSRWLNTNNSNVTSTATFYDTGMVQQKKDPLLKPTTYSYSSTFAGAYLTQECNALNQRTSYNYDSNIGLAVSTTDPNQQPTTYAYEIMSRLSGVTNPDGGGTTITYNDTASPPNALATTKITSSLNKVSTTVVDGIGRLTQTQLNSDPDGVDYTDVTYDANGRKASESNPHRSAQSGTDGTTTYLYDPLNRITTATKQDTSTVSTTYADNCTTVMDEAGKKRQSCTDGLGRLTAVTEDPSGLAYVTNYFYDTLDNLTCVEQHGGVTGTGCSSPPGNDRTSPWRVRRFTYDSLSRLLTSSNPESGAISYYYDSNGNVLTKTAPAPNQTGSSTVTTNYNYDQLNRLIKESYSDGSTPTVQFGYDGNSLTGCTTAPPGLTDSYPVGRRTSMCDGSGAASWKHDQMGRIKQERRTIGTVKGDYETDVYNLDGSVASLTALGYAIAYTYNGAARAKTAKNSADSFNYVTSANYAPFGGLTAMSMGPKPITVSNSYNSRLQPALLSASTSAATIVSLSYDFHSSTHADNGNVYQIVNNRDGNRTQNFLYDSLNRIQQAYTNGPNWGETFGPTATNPGVPPSSPGIDAWGNLTNRSAVNGKTNYEPPNCPAIVNNQLTTCSLSYDAAGNVRSNGATTYVFDAENRLISAAGMSYIYDGDGKRVEKCTGGQTPGTCTANATGTLYWTGWGSDPLAETDLAGNILENYVFFNGTRMARREPGTSPTFHFYFSDHLGTHSIVTNANGTMPPQEESDYYPYGREIPVSGADSNHYKFTGKERDSESGLDEFGARYYASPLGRFMTPDWATTPIDVPYADFGNPQSLNLYSYVKNNPTTTRDPDGHCCDDVLNFLGGAANAYGSDNLLGAGRVDQSTAAGKIGAAVGDFAATAQGAGEALFGGGVEVGGIALDATGVGAVAGVPANVAGAALMVHGGATAETGFSNLFKSGMAPKEGETGGPGSGKSIGDKTKAQALEENKAANGGQAKCVFCNEPVGEGTTNKINFDHAKAKANNGNNSLNNTNVACEYCNKSKGTGRVPKHAKKPDQNWTHSSSPQ